MTEVVEESAESDELSPAAQRESLRKLDVTMPVRLGRDHVENATRHLHHAEGMLESAVGSARIDQIRHRELMNVPQPLERPRVDRTHLVARNSNEVVNRIADLVLLRQDESDATSE